MSRVSPMLTTAHRCGSENTLLVSQDNRLSIPTVQPCSSSSILRVCLNGILYETHNDYLLSAASANIMPCLHIPEVRNEIVNHQVILRQSGCSLPIPSLMLNSTFNHTKDYHDTGEQRDKHNNYMVLAPLLQIR
eukprot:113062-Amphidinium_carterae.1